MLYVLIAISGFFIAIGYLVTVNNANYLLSGYNTMTEEERKKIDLKVYISFFKKFHIFLGLSFLVIGSSLIFLIGENAGGIQRGPKLVCSL